MTRPPLPARRCGDPNPRPLWRGFFAAASRLLAALPLLCAAAAGAQEHGGAHGRAGATWSIRAQVVPLLTHASPAMAGEPATEGYLTQPAVMAHATRGRVAVEGTLNLEGLTLRRGELNAGVWGEGYVDRRHPHTYLHELMASVWLRREPGVAASVSVGKGFAPFGTDDPMVRPLVKYPANHHLAQVLERAVAVAALRAGPVMLEAGVFNGEEPLDPADWPDVGRFGDSWSVRATLHPLPGVEAQASYAHLASPEFPAGSGIDHRKRSVSARVERARHNGDGQYVLVEWGRTDQRSFAFSTLLAEGALRRGGVEVAVRLEQSERPEEERLDDPFRSPHPHADVHLLGITRWRIASAALRTDGVRRGALRARPFLEVARARVEETFGSLVFQPAALYGADRLWSLSLGARVEAGAVHRRMGRYAAALPPGASH